MKAIVYKAVKNGRGYVETAYVPRNRSQKSRSSKWELIFAGGLVLLTATFVCLLLLVK